MTSKDKYAPFIGWKVMGWTHEKFQTEPTHWMPLPLPPTKDLADAGKENL